MASEDFSVYVSRLPRKWDNSKLKEHFEACFGPVSDVSIKWDDEHDMSMCYGFVNFVNTDDKNKAVEQGSMHVKKRTINIRPFVPKEIVGRNSDNDNSELRNGNICFLWQRHGCVRGDSCKFKHEGEGSCIVVSAPFQGKTRKCMSFKTKGKCSKGDACQFQHIAGANVNTNNTNKATNINNDIDSNTNNTVTETTMESSTSTSTSTSTPKTQGVCHTFQKKGKCRKGDSCKFSHELHDKSGSTTSNSGGTNSTITGDSIDNGGTRKRKLNGEELVKIRKQKLLADKAKEQQ